MHNIINIIIICIICNVIFYVDRYDERRLSGFIYTFNVCRDWITCLIMNLNKIMCLYTMDSSWKMTRSCTFAWLCVTIFFWLANSSLTGLLCMFFPLMFFLYSTHFTISNARNIVTIQFTIFFPFHVRFCTHTFKTIQISKIAIQTILSIN